MPLIPLTDQKAVAAAYASGTPVLQLRIAPDGTSSVTLPDGNAVEEHCYSSLRKTLAATFKLWLPLKQNLSWTNSTGYSFSYVRLDKRKTREKKAKVRHLTESEYRALSILRKNPHIPARTFAILYYGDTPSQHMLRSESPLRRGKYYGKQAWTTAATFLTRLTKKGYVIRVDQARPVRYRLSDAGRAKLETQEQQ